MSIGGELAVATLDRAPFTAALLNADGTVVWVNEAWRAFGRENGLDDPDDGIGRNYLDVTAEATEDDDAQRAWTELRAVLDGEQSTVSMEYPCHSPEERRWFRLHATRVDVPATSETTPQSGADRPQTEPFCLVTHQDISEPVERERLARRQREEFARLASMISHDVRNPLAVARGWVRILEGDATYDSDSVEAIDDALVRIDAIIEDAVTLLRTGMNAIETEACSLAAVAREAWQTVETHGATLAVDGDTTLSVNRGLLRSVLENLFRNSVEHSSTNRSPEDVRDSSGVHVRVGVLDAEEGFFVADNGPGIPSDVHDDVFEFGFSTGGGSGLGLAIVDQVVSLYEWSVAVTESVDGGARIEFYTGVSDD